MTIKGSCLCGKVKYQLSGPLTAPRYCHCDNCRKFSGTSPAAWAMANTADLHTDIASRIGEYNSGRGIRCFCESCGSPVWFKSIDYPDIVGIPLGSIDTGEVPEPTMHLWYESKPEWCVVTDQQKKFPQGPDET